MAPKTNLDNQLVNALGRSFSSFYHDICKTDPSFSPGKISLETRENGATATGYVSSAIACSDKKTFRTAEEVGKRALFAGFVKALDCNGFPLWPLLRSGTIFDFETALGIIAEWMERQEDFPTFDEVNEKVLNKLELPKFIAYMSIMKEKDDNLAMQSGIVVDSPYILDDEKEGLFPFHKWCARYFAKSHEK